ncbi:MAG: tRNA (adenosine(37)-N6)-dimethylallyltransferase MiaA [Acidiferrobacteraceae bacterium]
MGPTGSGKTEAAVSLCSLLPVEIISVDAAQVYRGLDIGTAKPSPAVRARAPHRLIDICDPAEAYSVARFCEDAPREMRTITTAGRVPLLVGGTIFYFHALEYGLSALPQADPEVRRRIAEEAGRVGWGALYERLKRLDPMSAAGIQPGDRQRIQRALEVVELTGEAASELKQRHIPDPLPYRLVKLAIVPKARMDLHARIEHRFTQMLDEGFVEEARALFARADIPAGAPALRTVGYRQIGQYLTGKISYNNMMLNVKAATRQLAKRQLTWLRHYDGVQWFNSDDKDFVDEIASFVRQSLGAQRIIGPLVK